MKKMINRRGFSVISGIVALVWISLAIIYYIYSLNDIQLKEQSKNLEEITKSNAIEVNYTIEKYIQVLSSAVAFIESYEDIACEAVLSKLNDIAGSTDFTRLAIDFVDGTGYTSDGANVNILEFDYVDRIKLGIPFVIDVVDASIDGEPTISVLVPIKSKDGVYNAALRGTISTNKFSEMLEKTFSKGGGYFHIVDGNGRYVAKKNSSDELRIDEKYYFDALDKLTFEEGYSAEQIKAIFENQEQGMSKYSYEGSVRYCYFEPVGVNQWVVMTVVPKEVAEHTITKHIANIAHLAIQILIIFAFTIFYIVITQKNAKSLLKENQEKLIQFAYYDEFSGAPTLAKFKIEAQKFIDEHKDKKLLMVKLDVKEFKLVNQILGTQVGNDVILNITKALKANTGTKEELYARLHDDEFLVLHIYEKEGENLLLKERFRKLLYEHMGEDFSYDLKIVSGHYYMSDDNCFNVAEAIEKANIAHRRAKQIGRANCVYDKEFIDVTLKQKEIESRAEKAIENREFKVFLQPKCELVNERIDGAEALVRWIDDRGNITFPNDFIPIFEQNGFITTLDFYMFEETCKIISGWIRDGITPVSVSVNFSRLHLFDPKFLTRLSNIADKHNVPSKFLEIELTETIVMDADHDLAGLITSLHEYGFLVSMDDFGTGYSSLGSLKNLNVDTIKLDRSFFLEAHENVKSHSILSNMLNMAIDLGIRTVAEGVEEQDHVDLLRKLNCDVIQGYYFGRPIPAQEFTQKLQNEGCSEKYIIASDTSERFNLRKNNELLTDMMDSMPLAFVLWDRNIKIVQCNKEMAIFLGFTNEEAFLLNRLDSIPKYQPDGRSSFEIMKQQVLCAFEHGQGQYTSWFFKHVDGTLLPSEVTLVRIVNKGEFMVAAYVRDTRLQLEVENMIKQEHLSLQALTNEYKQLLDHNPLCINIWNQDKILMCNKAVCSMFGVEDEQIFVDCFHEFSPEYQPDGSKSSEKVAENFRRAYEEGQNTFFWMHQKLNGEPVPTEIMLVRIKLNGEEVLAAFVRDISVQIEAENAIKEEYVKLKTMMDASPLCFNLWDEQMHNTMCNKAAIALFDLESEEEYLTRFFELSPEHQPDGQLSSERAQEFIQRAFETGSITFEWMHKKLNGEEILAEITLNRIELNGMPFIAGFTRNLGNPNNPSST